MRDGVKVKFGQEDRKTQIPLVISPPEKWSGSEVA